MWTLLLLALLVGVRAGDQNGGIIGGHIVANHSKPWMACLLNKSSKVQICGGALISEHFVLTAAHCSKYDFTDVEVVLGVQNKTKPDTNWQTFQNVSPRFQEDYNAVTKVNDIVLLKLTKAAVLNQTVEIIPLPPGDRDIATGTVCTVAGWGRTERNGNMSDMLMEVNVTVLDNADCDKYLGMVGPHMKGSMLCAGKHEGGKDAGVNDSGGPLVCNGIVEGIVSHGTENSPPAVYTRVSKYAEWIRKTIKKSG